jgi:hypothetical protein
MRIQYPFSAQPPVQPQLIPYYKPETSTVSIFVKTRIFVQTIAAPSPFPLPTPLSPLTWSPSYPDRIIPPIKSTHTDWVGQFEVPEVVTEQSKYSWRPVIRDLPIPPAKSYPTDWVGEFEVPEVVVEQGKYSWRPILPDQLTPGSKSYPTDWVGEFETPEVIAEQSKYGWRPILPDNPPKNVANNTYRMDWFWMNPYPLPSTAVVTPLSWNPLLLINPIPASKLNTSELTGSFEPAILLPDIPYFVIESSSSVIQVNNTIQYQTLAYSPYPLPAVSVIPLSWNPLYPDKLIPPNKTIFTDPAIPPFQPTAIPKEQSKYEWRPLYPDSALPSVANLLRIMDWFWMNPYPLPSTAVVTPLSWNPLYPDRLIPPNKVIITDPAIPSFAKTAIPIEQSKYEWRPLYPDSVAARLANLLRIMDWAWMWPKPIPNVPPVETSASWYGQFPDRLIQLPKPTHTDPATAYLTPKDIVTTYPWKGNLPTGLPLPRIPNTLWAMQWFFMYPKPIPYSALVAGFSPQPNPVGGTNPQAHGPKGWTVFNKGASNANGGKAALRMLQALGISLYDKDGVLRPMGVTGTKSVSVGVVTPKGEPQQNPPIDPYAPGG